MGTTAGRGAAALNTAASEDVGGSASLPRDLETEEPNDALLARCCGEARPPLEACVVCLEILSSGPTPHAGDPLEQARQAWRVSRGESSDSPSLVRVTKCGHQFHKNCLAACLQQRRRCPVCSDSFGVCIGSGPKQGEFSWSCKGQPLPGFSSGGHLRLDIRFYAGTDDAGQRYSARSQTAYLPDSEEGRQLVALFVLAFKRRLLFGIGDSLTRGCRWPTFNIHLKTKMYGGAAAHGFPDPDYITRAFRELAENGLHVADLPRRAEVSGPVCVQCGCQILGVVCMLQNQPFHFGCGPQAVPDTEGAAPTLGVAGLDAKCDRCGDVIDGVPILQAGCKLHFGCSLQAGSDSTAGALPTEEQSRAQLECSREPEDVAMQTVEIVRREGESLPNTQFGRDILNFDLAARFIHQMHAFGDSGGLQWAAAEVVFHWTREGNISSIVENNLRVAGESYEDGVEISQAHGARLGRGIYAATTISHGVMFGHGAPAALLCIALPGRACLGSRLEDGYDSLQHGDVRVYANSSQLLPLFLTNQEQSGQARQSAQRVVEFLRGRLPTRWRFSMVNEW